jgi:hypothetical protein
MDTKFYFRPSPIGPDAKYQFVKGLYEDGHAQKTDLLPVLHTLAVEEATLVLIGGRDSLKTMLKNEKFDISVMAGFNLGILFSRASTFFSKVAYSVIQVVAYKPNSKFGQDLTNRDDWVTAQPTSVTNQSLSNLLGSLLDT